MSRHERFEELCALAALGEISADEFDELRAHLEVCGSCQVKCSCYTDILDNKLPLVAPPRSMVSARLDQEIEDVKGYEERFARRAQALGIHFSHEAAPRKGPPAVSWKRAISRIGVRPAYAVILAALMLTTGILAYVAGRKSGARGALSLAAAGRMEKEPAAQGAEPAEPSSAQPRNAETTSGESNDVDGSRAKDGEDRRALEAELSKAREDYATLQEHSKAVENEFQMATQEVENLRAESQSLKSQAESNKGANSDLENRLRDEERSLAQLNDEVKALRDRSARDAMAIATAEARIKELSSSPASPADSGELEKLLAADRDIRELMGARRLHMIDVSDVDGNGRTRRAFGRIFYTESKSLIFYAFDLGDKKGSAAARSFQAWGYREPAEQSVRSLGLFYVDSKTQNRWVLKFDDPAVLAHINAVFVTIEPQGGSNKPSGQKLLYAYLASPPNHP